MTALQTAAKVFRSPLTLPRTLLWLFIAIATGLVAGTQPIGVVFAFIALATLVTAIVQNPMAVLAFLVVIAPLRTLYATEAPRLALPAVPLDFGQWLVFALIASWVLQLIRERRLPQWAASGASRHTLSVFTPLLLFIATGGMSGFSAHSLSAWMTEWLKWLQIALLALIIADLCMSGMRDTVILLLIVAGSAHAIIGVFQYFGGSGALHLLINERNFRAFGTFGQPNPFGGFMGILFPVAFAGLLAALTGAYIAMRRHSGTLLADAALKMLVFGAASALIAVALIMSWSRGAWLGFGLSLAVMLFALPRRLIHSLLLAGFLVVFMGSLGASGRLPASLTARLGTITQDIFDVQDVRGVDITPANYAVVERLAHWQAAINMATEHPWLGVGLGNYGTTYADYRLINWKFPLGHAHNIYLNMLAEAGVVGLSTYVAFICSILWYAWRCRRHPSYDIKLLSVGILGVWVYLVVHSLTDNLYVNNMFIHLSVTIGVLVSISREIPRRRTG